MVQDISSYKLYTITECVDGYYGQDCANECQCQNGAICDFRTGSCNCTAGWMGQFCNISTNH